MAGMVLAIAVVSNLCQYLYDGPLFGGMSGVAYGLFGYIWIKSRVEPSSGFYMHQTTVMVMLVWFVLCFTPVLGGVANGAHAAGLANRCSGWHSCHAAWRRLGRNLRPCTARTGYAAA